MQDELHGMYNHNVVTVKRLGDNLIKICEVASTRIRGMESGTLEDDAHPKSFLIDSPKKYSSSDKLDNNIARAKTRVRELALCNDWDWWCTFTLDNSKVDRYDLKTLSKLFAEFIHNYNRRRDEDIKVKYLLVPEKHKDGAWHMHGFIKGLRECDLYRNEHGFWSWKPYETKFGYISLDKIKDKERASTYISKYLTKDISKNVTELGAHLYYSSKGLKEPELIFRGHAELHSTWDYEHPEGYCKIKTIDSRVLDISEILEVLE